VSVVTSEEEQLMSVCPRCHARFADGRFCPTDGVALVAEELTPRVPGLEIGRELGRGLTGIVWRARDASGRALAIKVLNHEWAEHHEMRERFLREARAASAVTHPCVVAPLALGTLDDGRPYLVMELVDGPTLEEVLALGPLPEARAAAIAADLASALADVHHTGVVHRDVKPGNVKIARDGRPRLLDFGVARRLDSDEPRLTGGGLTVGTPHYMAPEQCTGDLITGRTDVYALGCVLYRMLAGEVPFDGAAVAVMLAHAAREPTPLRERAPGVTPRMARLVERCLAKRIGDRPDATELAEQLAAIAAGAAVPTAGTHLRLGRASTVPAEPYSGTLLDGGVGRAVLAAARRGDESGPARGGAADAPFADAFAEAFPTGDPDSFADVFSAAELAAVPPPLARLARGTPASAAAVAGRFTGDSLAGFGGDPGTSRAEDLTTTRVPTVRRPWPARRIARVTVGVALLAAALLAFNATPFGHDVAHRLGLHFHPDLPFFAGPLPRMKPRPIPPPPPVDPDQRGFLVAADEGVALRLGAPAHLTPGVEHELTIEAWNADGDPIDTNDMVVTFSGPDGALVGFAAEPTRTRGMYRVRTRFARDGGWTVRVFPPVGDAMVTFRLDVGDAIPST